MNTKKNQIVSLEKDRLSFTFLGYCFSIGFFIILFSLTTSSTFKEFKTIDSSTEDVLSAIPPIILETPKPRTMSEKLMLSHSTRIAIGMPLDTSSYFIDLPQGPDTIEFIASETQEIVNEPKLKSIYIPYELTDLPSFVGGDKELEKYFNFNLIYPKRAIEDGIEGVVNVVFIVEADGSISNISVDAKSPKIGSGCETEAIRVVKNMPKWLPGKVRDKAVRVLCSMPITFSLEDKE